jgi:hypothetical protein
VAGWEDDLGRRVQSQLGSPNFTSALAVAAQLGGADSADLLGMLWEPTLARTATVDRTVQALLRAVRTTELIGVTGMRVGALPYALVLEACLWATTRDDQMPEVWLLRDEMWRTAVDRRATVTLSLDEAQDAFNEQRVAGAAFAPGAACLVFGDGRSATWAGAEGIETRWSPSTDRIGSTPLTHPAFLSVAFGGRRLMYGLAGASPHSKPDTFELTLADEAVILHGLHMRVVVHEAPSAPPPSRDDEVPL